MNKSEKIPLLEINGLDEFHFGNTNLKFIFSDSHSIFHINRLKGMNEKLNFPLPPHRKAVFDLIFLTKGNSTRSKGLNKYTFGKNQFFFSSCQPNNITREFERRCRRLFCAF